MPNRAPEAAAEEEPGVESGLLVRWLAANSLLFLLPVAFLAVTFGFWSWALGEENERIHDFTSEELTRVADAVAGRARGHADASSAAASRWLLRDPRDQAEWDYDLFARRWLNPELETVEWVDADLVTRWVPSDRPPVVSGAVPRDELERAAREHRVVVAGPFFLGQEPISLTIVPIERPGESTEWLVSVYDLERMLRSSLAGSRGSFGIALVADGREVFVNNGEDRLATSLWQRRIDLGYDRLDVQLEIWPTVATVGRFRTSMPRMALIGGLLATAVLALGIRLAQVSSRRAIESRLTASLQEEIQARKRAERSLERKLEELSRSNREFERFAYAISHDLRDPLNAISLHLGLMLDEAHGRLDADSRHAVEQAVSAASRLDAMIGSLLDYARAGAADGFELVDVQESLDEATANLRALIAQHDVSVRSGRLPKVVANRAALVRIFQNLVSNAIKYRGEQPPVVEVKARSDDGGWVVSVADNGRGMSDEQAERAFELFWRQEAGDATGEGIGLAVCKRIVEQHGGDIWIESREGAGTTLSFFLPADPELAIGAGAAPPTSRRQN